VLWSPVFGFRGRRIELHQEEIDCKLVCSHVRNLEEEIDCELAGWNGNKTHRKAAIFHLLSRSCEWWAGGAFGVPRNTGICHLGALFASTTYTACLSSSDRDCLVFHACGSVRAQHAAVAGTEEAQPWNLTPGLFRWGVSRTSVGSDVLGRSRAGCRKATNESK
jgi:hypothetical protein